MNARLRTVLSYVIGVPAVIVAYGLIFGAAALTGFYIAFKIVTA